MNYVFSSVSPDKAFYLGDLIGLFDEGEPLDFFVPESCEKINRKTFDGFITFISVIHGQKVAICYNDFRGYGSTFGVDNSLRIGAFLEELSELGIPLVYFANSSGIRVQDSRKVFRNSFTLVNKIKKFSEKNLYISACLGQSLGLSALLYSLGDYRMAIKDSCKFNLTGPEIFKLFFGEKVDFATVCNAETMLEESKLVQEIFDDKFLIFERVRSLFEKPSSNTFVDKKDLVEISDLTNFIIKNSIEVFSGFGKSLQTFLMKTNEGYVGVLLNPFGKPNMMTVEDIEKFRFSLQLFKKLKLPFLNFVDTAGGDPRITENNKNIARHLYDLASDIIDYPFYKRGVILGRCFGGTSILSIPVFFGGDKTILALNAKIGIMDSKIIRHLLSSAKPLLKTWEENLLEESENYSDYVDDGLVENPMPTEHILPRVLSDLKRGRHE